MWECRDACHCGVNALFWCQVTVSGTTAMFSRSRGNVTGLSLMNGVNYNVSVVARNMQCWRQRDIHWQFQCTL